MRGLLCVDMEDMRAWDPLAQHRAARVLRARGALVSQDCPYRVPCPIP